MISSALHQQPEKKTVSRSLVNETSTALDIMRNELKVAAIEVIMICWEDREEEIVQLILRVPNSTL